MEKKILLEKYNKNYTEEQFYKDNVVYAFSEEQLQKAMQKLGVHDKNQLTTFGYGSICLKSKVNDILSWIAEKKTEKANWLKSLTRAEQKIIIAHELYNYECTYTGDIEIVVELFNGIFEKSLIVSVWDEIK